MASRLKELVETRDSESILNYVDTLQPDENWSFITLIDDLLPAAVMESYLSHNNFHAVKASLFMRELAQRKILSRVTEKSVLSMLARHLAFREWISVSAGYGTYNGKAGDRIMETFIEQLNDNNVHNAFYCLNGMITGHREPARQLLLTMGASQIHKTLGHSLSCFYPVIESMYPDTHPAASSALFSYCMYLSRFQYEPSLLHNLETPAPPENEMSNLLSRCSSGTGIINLHHTITFYIYRKWAGLVNDTAYEIPWHYLEAWVSGKEIDSSLLERMQSLQYRGTLPADYGTFYESLSINILNSQTGLVCALLESDPDTAFDWVIRFISDHYESGWDPHTITGPFAALQIYIDETDIDVNVRRMAVYQALDYVRERMGNR